MLNNGFPVYRDIVKKHIRKFERSKNNSISKFNLTTSVIYHLTLA